MGGTRGNPPRPGPRGPRLSEAPEPRQGLDLRCRRGTTPPFLLHPRKRGLQNLDRMARYASTRRSTCSSWAPGPAAYARAAARTQRLARRDPREGAVLGSRPGLGQRREGLAGIYWTDKRIVGGDDPIELGKNNSGVGVGGSMTHFAGYVPRFHPSDFETRTRDGVGADWPISYWDLKPSIERIERELPVAGQDWPWGDPHTYPHGPHPVGGAASKAWQGARRHGIEMRVGPVLDHERHRSETGRTASIAASACRGAR